MSQSFQRGGRSSYGAPRFQQRSNRGFSRGPQRSNINRSRYISAAVAPAEVEEVVIVNSFADFGLNQELTDNITRHGYTTPTPIQDKAIPALMEGRDVVGIANTGTGKTAAFLLPLIHKIMADNTQGALILAPTRELAVQIMEEFRVFAQRLPVSVCLCIGGQSMSSQISTLRRDPHFIIGTPGRIKDLINRNYLKTSLYTNIVLDEVDRMLDIGFRQDIKFLISQLPAERHCAFFSATLNQETEEIMRMFLHDPVRISVKTRETAQQIEQDIVQVRNGENKLDLLHKMLQGEEFEKVIVFGRTKHGIDKLEKHLSERGIRVSAIHGNKTQGARQRSLQDFKRGNVQALLATDIAARGIDVSDVTHVINFDEPQSYEDYVHRIGRTGRAGKIGKALTFVG